MDPRERPTEGGRYIRQKNGKLKRVEFTEFNPTAPDDGPPADPSAEARSAKAEAGAKPTTSKGS